ncbi:hypothetical protein G6027_06310 [Dietzia sp. SLG310A2-38A2]|uniref:major capsid protein n=1 Tax=Dietzia sp. SLG310A2-38A2 TaxID=1630643 RepID=UPI0015F838A7|nr:major capsid protein [Dietzia sp. SLG310A2-38A2]MBB1030500.1 hypothetical protein [Dietzia sp. SLG310A2-38A2]
MSSNPVGFPLGKTTSDKGKISVDAALNYPARITQAVVEMTANSIIFDKLFSQHGTLASHSVVYWQSRPGDQYMDRRLADRGVGDQVQIVGPKEMPDPLVANSRDVSGRYYIPDEARLRNTRSLLLEETTRLGNTIARELNYLAVDTIEEAVSTLEGAVTVAGNDWAATIIDGASPTPPGQRPTADFANVQLSADRDEIGVTYDLWIVNPIQHASLKTTYGKDYQAVLDSAGVEIFPTNRVERGTAYALAKNRVGFLAYEKMLETTVYREDQTMGSWVQMGCKVLMGVTSPYAMRKVVGLENLG